MGALAQEVVLYRCGAGYAKTYGDTFRPWKARGGCSQPRPLAILEIAAYWAGDDEGFATNVRDMIVAAWTRNTRANGLVVY
jgi:hypothetical protein